jgi:hypothetical protein
MATEAAGARVCGAGQGNRERIVRESGGLLAILLSVTILWRVYWRDAPQNSLILWRIPPVDAPLNLFPFFIILVITHTVSMNI